MFRKPSWSHFYNLFQINSLKYFDYFYLVFSLSFCSYIWFTSLSPRKMLKHAVSESKNYMESNAINSKVLALLVHRDFFCWNRWLFYISNVYFLENICNLTHKKTTLKKFKLTIGFWPNLNIAQSKVKNPWFQQ